MRTLPLTNTLQASTIKSSKATHLLGWCHYPINRVFQLLGLRANLEYNEFKPPHSFDSSALRTTTDCPWFLALVFKHIT